MSESNAQDIANKAWAFVAMKHLYQKLFIALAGGAERRVSEFNEQNLANTAWAGGLDLREPPEVLAQMALVDSAKKRIYIYIYTLDSY